MSDYWDDMKAAAAIKERLDGIEAKLDELLALLRPVPEISGSLPLSNGGYGRPPVHDPNGGRR